MHPSRWGRWQPGCAGDSSLSVRVAAARAHPHVRPPPCSQHSVGVSRAQSSSPQGPTCHLFPASPAARAELHSPSPGQGRLLFRRHVARCTPRSAARTSKGRPEVFALLALLDSDKRGTRAVLRVPAAAEQIRVLMVPCGERIEESTYAGAISWRLRPSKDQTDGRGTISCMVLVPYGLEGK